MAVSVDKYADALVALVASGTEPKEALGAVVAELQKTGFSRWERLVQAIERAYDKHEGIIAVRASSGKPVTAKDQKALAQALGEQVELDWSVDPTLIGGVKFESNELVIDGTVKGIIKQLTESLNNV